MRKLLISTVIAGGLAFGGAALAAEQQEITLEGKVSNVQGSTLKVQGDSKQAHTFKVPDQQDLQGLKSGDEVTITIIPQPMIQTEGEVTQSKGGTLQIQDEEGGTYSIQAGDSEELKNLKPGDKVQISIESSAGGG